MQKRAALHVSIAIGLLGVYWVLGTVFGAFLPSQLVIQTSLLFVLALLIGGSVAEVTRSLTILALAMQKA